MEISLISAFWLGLVSFLAPCTFSTLPIFISYLLSQSTGEDIQTSHPNKSRILLGTLSYVFGFLIVFVLLGLSATSIGRFLQIYRTTFTQIGGIVIFFFGAFILWGGKFKKLQFMFAEKKIEVKKLRTPKGYGFAIITGATSAFAWTPCIGPILGTILLWASLREQMWEGGLLLLTYGLGIMLPFILVALSLDRSKILIQKFQKHTHIIYKISGYLLLILGILLMFNLIGYVHGGFYQIFDFFGYEPR